MNINSKSGVGPPSQSSNPHKKKSGRPRNDLDISILNRPQDMVDAGIRNQH
jgi:hypothetical protein